MKVNAYLLLTLLVIIGGFCTTAQAQNCVNFSGAWKTDDPELSEMRIVQRGCNISGGFLGGRGSYAHQIEGQADLSGAKITVLRISEGDDFTGGDECRNTMQGRLTKQSNDTVAYSISGTSGTCGVSATHTEKRIWKSPPVGNCHFFGGSWDPPGYETTYSRMKLKQPSCDYISGSFSNNMISGFARGTMAYLTIDKNTGNCHTDLYVTIGLGDREPDSLFYQLHGTSGTCGISPALQDDFLWTRVDDGDCDSFAGKWTTSGLSPMNLRQSGCHLDGSFPNHTITAVASGNSAEFFIGRTSSGNCGSELYATVLLTGPNTLNYAVTNTDGACGLDPNYTEYRTWTRVAGGGGGGGHGRGGGGGAGGNPPPNVSTCQIRPSRISIGQTATLVITLDRDARPGGTTLAIDTNSNGAQSTLVITPTSVTVVAGKRSASISLQTQAVPGAATRIIFSAHTPSGRACSVQLDIN